MLELVNDQLNGKWFYVNPQFPETILSPVFDDSSYALQWRGRVGQENVGDIAELQQELDRLKNGDTIILPKNREHAKAMLRVATFYLDNHDPR